MAARLCISSGCSSEVVGPCAWHPPPHLVGGVGAAGPARAPAHRRRPLLSPSTSRSAATRSRCLHESKASGRIGNSNFPFWRSTRGVYFRMFILSTCWKGSTNSSGRMCQREEKVAGGRAPAPGRCFPSGRGEQTAKGSCSVFMDPLRRRPSLGSGTLLRDASVQERRPSCLAAQSGRLGCPEPGTAPASASQGGEAAPGWVAPFFIWRQALGLK